MQRTKGVKPKHGARTPWQYKVVIAKRFAKPSHVAEVDVEPIDEVFGSDEIPNLDE